MASPTLTELFEFTPYPWPRAGRELEAAVVVDGAAPLSVLLLGVEFLAWGPGAANAIAPPTRRMRDQEQARMDARIAARTSLAEIEALVLQRCPGLVDVLNQMSLAGPEAGDDVADRLAADGTGNPPSDAAKTALVALLHEVRRVVGEVPAPPPILPGARAVLDAVRSLNTDRAQRAVADLARIDNLAAQSGLTVEGVRADLGVGERAPDDLEREADCAALFVLDMALAYANRREEDPRRAKVLERLVRTVLEVASTTIDEAVQRDVAELQIVVERAYERARAGEGELRKLLREEAQRFAHSAVVLVHLEEFVIPMDDLAADGAESGEAQSVVGLGGPRRAASTMVRRVFGDGVGHPDTLERRVRLWEGATRMTAFGVSPTPRDRLRHACRLVTTNDADAERLLGAAVAATNGSWFWWRAGGPVRWG